MTETGETRDNPTLLLVDDEENILNALRRALRRENYEILTATSGKEGLVLLDERKITLVCSDHRMPEMTGVEFLTEVKKRSPSTIRIMLTGYADIKATMEAINSGEVYRYISKPWNDDEIRLIIREAIERHGLVRKVGELNAVTERQNQELRDLNNNLEQKVLERTHEVQEKNKELKSLYSDLERGFTEFIKVFMGLMELKSPYLGGHSKRVAALSRRVAERLQLPPEEILNIEIAAILEDIGTMGFPEKMLKKREDDMDSLEKALMSQHPSLGQDRLQHIQKMKPAGYLIRHHHERFDGRGYPDKLRGEQIPIGARIIAIADAYAGLIVPPEFYTGFSMDRALSQLEKDAGARFDPRLVQEFIAAMQSLTGEKQEEDVIETTIEGLKEGMILAEDLKTHHGLLLMAKGEVVRSVHLVKIENFHRMDPIVSRIFVYRKSSKDDQENSDKEAVSAKVPTR